MSGSAPWMTKYGQPCKTQCKQSNFKTARCRDGNRARFCGAKLIWSKWRGLGWGTSLASPAHAVPGLWQRETRNWKQGHKAKSKPCLEQHCLHLELDCAAPSAGRDRNGGIEKLENSDGMGMGRAGGVEGGEGRYVVLGWCDIAGRCSTLEPQQDRDRGTFPVHLQLAGRRRWAVL